MIEEIEIKLWNEVAAYAAYRGSKLVHFEYAKSFPFKYELAPLMMPRKENKIWSFDLNEATYQGLPGLLADSLPDRYGMQMMNAWFSQEGVNPADINSLDRLCYLGTRAMGALEFYPNKELKQTKNKQIELNKLIEISEKILQERIEVSTDEEELLRVIKMSSSAGGARAKAVIAMNTKTGEIRSGQIQNPGFSQWIIKFDGLTNESLTDPQGYTNIEYAYYLIAKDLSIDIAESKLLNQGNRSHFLTKRFDRLDDGSKVHMQTMCGIAHMDYNSPRLYSYEHLFRIANQLELPMCDKEQIFKRMAFNVIGKNHDDHTKNFSFLLKQDSKWRLAPAYDLTFSYNPQNHWLKEHNLLVNGKSSNITDQDMLHYAKFFHIKNAEIYIENTKEVFANWLNYADQANLNCQKASEIEEIIN